MRVDHRSFSNNYHQMIIIIQKLLSFTCQFVICHYLAVKRFSTRNKRSIDQYTIMDDELLLHYTHCYDVSYKGEMVMTALL